MATQDSSGSFARSGGYSKKQLQARAYSQLIGLCRGVLADGVLADGEIVALDRWCDDFRDLLPDWPGRRLAEHVKDILRDGHIDEQERADLADFLSRMAGESGDGELRYDAPTTLPLTDPAPHIEYDGRLFVCTGTFVYGTRAHVERAIRDMGGLIAPSCARTDYLIIGATITPAWKFSTHGRKIEDAVERNAAGGTIAIVTEEHWATSLC